MIKESKPVDIKQEDLSSPTEKNGVHLGIEKSECLGDEGEDRKMKKKRKLIIDDESDEDAPPVPVDKFTDGIRSITQDKLHLPSHRDYSMGTAQPDKPLPDSAAECYSYNPVSPIAHPVWRGYFNVCDRKYGPAVAHLSNGACEKACDAADMLPQVLHFERLPRLEAWPESFKCSGPTKNNIAVYFFPGDVRAEAVFEQLLRDVIKKDLTLKVTVHKAELLVFPSMLNEVTEKPTGESEAACLTGRASRDRLSYESSHFIEILKKPDMGTFNSNMEFNLSGEYQGDSLAACLELFPLGAEDLGIAGKVQGSNEVDIELGLETVKGRK
ncbi:hypothetical protein Taro_030735, partial [Colocasia esculenta]|nr:hypothetical protein [Colocasia esculenta]